MKPTYHGILPQVEVETVLRIQSSALVELHGKSHQRSAAEGLRNPHHARDFCSPKVNAAKAVKVASLLVERPFKLVGRFDHGNLSIYVKVYPTLARREFEQRLTSIIIPAVADQPPRRLGGQKHPDQNQRRPDPLECERKPVGQLILPVDHAS